MGDEETTKKSRARQACETCRRKKTKCSGETPICSNCASHGFECSYVGVEKRRGPQKGYVRALESRLDSLQNLLEDYVEKISPAVNSVTRSDSLVDGGEVFFEEELLETRSSQNSSPKFGTDKDLNLLSRNVIKASTSNPRIPLHSMAPKKTGHLTIVENGSSKYCGESSGAYLLQKSSDEAQVFYVPPDSSNRKDTLLSLNQNIILTQVQLDAFISLYFSTIHCFLPMMIKDDFISEYKKPNSSIPRCLLDAICAASSAYASRSSMSGILNDATKVGESCFVRSRQHILSLVDQASISNIQALLLLSLCHHLNFGSMHWINLGIALRMAVEIGLHRDYNPSNPTLEDLKEREVRRRVWWCCYILDRMACITAGRPLTIDEDEYDTQFPGFEWETLENLNLVTETSPITTMSLDSRKKYFYRYTELSQIYGKVTRNIYSVKSRQGYSALKLQSHIQHIDDNLQSWYISLKKDWPQLENPNGKEPEISSFSLYLDISYHALVILLHRPLLPRPDSQINSFTKPYYDKCKISANQIVQIIKKDIDNFIDLALSFKIYPLVAAFSIHILGASSSVQDDSFREESKALVLDCLCVLSRFSSLPLFKKILFGCFNTLTSLKIVPLGFIDDSWPGVLKLASKSFAMYMANIGSKNKNNDGDAASGSSNTSNLPTTTSTLPLNPTEFLKSKVLNGNSTKENTHDGSIASNNADSSSISSHPNKRFKEQATPSSSVPNFVSLQPSAYSQQSSYPPMSVQTPINSNISYEQTKVNDFNPSFQNQDSSFKNSPQSYMPANLPMASNQMMFNSFANPNVGYQPQAPMLQYMNNVQPNMVNPSQFMSFPFNNQSLPLNQQAFGQGEENFIWDPLYNFDFTGFNNNGN